MNGVTSTRDERRDLLQRRLHELVDEQIWEQSFVLEREAWGRNRQNRGFLLAQVAERKLLPTDTPTEQNHALETICAINRSVHDGRRTPGLAHELPIVAAAQGGQYCRLCGERGTSLQVDHIVPASRAGSDDLENLQLLCVRCNSGKSNMEHGRLTVALNTNSTEVLSDSLRYLRLALTSQTVERRPMGACDCGSAARDASIEVRVKSRATANLLNLFTTCERCNANGDY